MTEYSKLLNHLGIDKNQMLSSMRSKLPDCEKPYQVKRCIHFNSCESGKLGGCRGCNIWNYLYDINALRKWCQKHNKDFTLMTMDIHKQLKEED
jgi:hypothetical protein